MRNAICAIAAALLLSSCGDDLAPLKADLAARLEKGNELYPLPEMLPLPKIRYESGKLPDPFYPDRR